MNEIKSNAPANEGMDAFAAADEAITARRNRLDQSIMLEEQGPGSLFRIVALLIVAFAIAFIVWATNTRLSEVVVSSGEVAPAGSVKRVQHLEGGIIDQIHVRDGSIVKKGDVLMTLAPSAAAPERDQLQARLAGLQVEAEQLSAVVSGKPLNAQASGKFTQLVNSQLQVFKAKQEAIQAQLTVIDKQISQRRSERQALIDQVPGIRNQIKIIKEQLEIRKSLSAKGLQPRLILLDNERELARTEALLVENRGQQKAINESIAELRSRKIEIDTRLKLEAAESLGKINSEIAELNEAVAQVEDKVSRLEIRSPVDGIIQNLRTETLGGVIKAGETVAEVIPTGAELIVEARVKTNDIGFVFKGQKASVKVLTYDFTRYGEIDGTIDQISATTIEDDKGEAHYLAYIKLAKNYVGDQSDRNVVVPGMTVLADIKTGEKTLSEYLLKPIYKAFAEAFRER